MGPNEVGPNEVGPNGVQTSGVGANIVNALIGAASDPEAVVRAAAVRSLGLIADRRSVMPVVARLTDSSRVVRASAAETLLQMGVASLPGGAGVALARAQDEYALSLSTFPDIAADHTSLAWLHMSVGKTNAAERELAVAIELDPSDARPHVFRGVLAARGERYAEALGAWRTAKDINPAYPNLDSLMAEARRRLEAPRKPGSPGPM
ncbi:MAG: HEAT repeat domain-containing protein [Acidobacteria bacterium]|nr:HEAT repeat domain-containing protein [Acidobacteriota bacterium]